jgi:SnoaL-like domain
VTLGPADRLALRALVDAYAVAVDRRDVAGFVDLFTPDATLATFEADGSRRSAHQGQDELATIPPLLDRYERTLHLMSTHHVEDAIDGGPEGDEATGVAYCEAHHHRPPEPPGDTGATDHVLFIRYVDRYARRGPGWLIRARDVHVIWSEDRPLV